MKRTLLSVFVWLALTMVWEGSQLFAGGIVDALSNIGRKKDVQSDITEVPDIDYQEEIRKNEARKIAEARKGPAVQRNPNTIQAGGNVYALPAEALNPVRERLPPPAHAISGVKDVELKDGDPMIVDIIVNLPGKETFSRGILEGEDVSEWIPNLPAGLEARAHGIKKGAKTIKIYVAGTPEVTAREVVRVTIPGTYLTGGTARQFVSPMEEESYNAWQKSQTE
jgi:hypothetical protein